MNAVRDQLKRLTLYKVGDDFYVRQRTVGEVVSFEIGNSNPNYRFLGEGSAPHTIEQRPHMIPLDKLVAFYDNLWLARVVQQAVARRGVVIEHPGIEPDYGVIARVQDLQLELERVVMEASHYWAQHYGQEVV
jgi:hypothetical protein